MSLLTMCEWYRFLFVRANLLFVFIWNPWAIIKGLASARGASSVIHELCPGVSHRPMDSTPVVYDGGT